MDDQYRLEITLTEESTKKTKEDLKNITVEDILYFEIRSKTTNEVICRWENSENFRREKN